MDKIDFVIPWVDGNDPKWIEEKNKYCTEKNDKKNGENRYRDMGILKYWFRAVEKYASWVNKIYFITWGHIPEWLNTENKKIVVVNHKDYIPHEYLPTFSSHVIELNIHRIKDLSEKFVYFNDDMFINDYMSKEDFFKNNLPREYAILNPIIPTTDFEHIVLNDIKVINNNYDKGLSMKKNRSKWLNICYGKDNIRTLFLRKWKNVCGLKESHLPCAYLKSTFSEVWNREYNILNETSKHKFRTNEDVNQWVIKYWQIMNGQFIPRNPSIGKRFELSNDNRQIIQAIKNRKFKMICINDADMNYDFERAKSDLITVFEEIYPEKSTYEI